MKLQGSGEYVRDYVKVCVIHGRTNNGIHMECQMGVMGMINLFLSLYRSQQEMEFMRAETSPGPILMEELQALRYHKSELEEKLTNLQDSRQQLMGQLEGLMKLLKVRRKNRKLFYLPFTLAGI